MSYGSRRRTGMGLGLVLLGCLAGAFALADSPMPLAEMQATADGLFWQPAAIAHAGVSLRVTGPVDQVWDFQFAPGEPVFFAVYDDLGGLRPDGQYIYEIRFTPAGALVNRGLDGEAAPATGGEAAAAGKTGWSTGRSLVQSGAFLIDHGFPVAMDLLENGGLKDQVVPDDMIVQGSLCVGLDCVNNESFGFDTIRLKENNTRIKFEDTSVGTFPSTDWQLTANDSASGGGNRFSIEDITAATVPFTVAGAARTNSLYVSSSGRIGFGTAKPLEDAHYLNTDTPTIRFEQTGAGGFTPQTWDIAGNEANFFIRDVTGGARLPLRIRPGAPTSSLDIAADGSVGLGTASPSALLHLKKAGATLRVEDSDPVSGARNLLELVNSGATTLSLSDTTSHATWLVGSAGGIFSVSTMLPEPKESAGIFLTPEGEFMIRNNAEDRRLVLDFKGNLKIKGTYQQLSDVSAKQDFAAVDERELLDRLARVPVTTWRYKNDPEFLRHLGPTAQDFHQAFGLGGDDTHIALTDAAGVSLAAVKGLYGLVQAQEVEIQALKQQNAELEDRLRALEEAVSALRRP